MTAPPFAFDLSRRTVIKGAAGLAGAASIGAAPFVVLGQPAANIRVRQDVVEFAKDGARLAKFEAAVREMQERSAANPGDPRGWLVNAKAHADFCAVPGSTNPPLDPRQIHFCWWFLSWHRAYIAVTERKIREIAGDQTLCYPYWNWSSDRRIPMAYAKPGSPLAKAERFTPNRPLDDGEVDHNPNDPVLKRLGVSALSVRVFEAAAPQNIHRSFGGIARPNPANGFGMSRLEGTPHGPVHVYVGGENDEGMGGDMSDFETAGRDPIFFAHHGNLDRLWEIWRKDPARKATEPTTNAFLKHKFVFTGLDGTPVEVAVEDTMDTRKLGYTYDNLEVFRPGAPIVVAAQSAEGRPPPIASENIRVPLAPQAADENERRILEITDVEKPDRLMTVGVYLKPANAPSDELGVNVGSFAAVRSGGEIAWPSQTLSFDVTAAANRFAGQELTVQLVPYRIRAQGAESYPQLKYGQMRLITER